MAIRTSCDQIAECRPGASIATFRRQLLRSRARRESGARADPGTGKALRRRSSIESEIGHMKTDGLLARCFPKGAIGDALFAVLSAAARR
nr:hypothetical protein DWF04_11270 [Cereibacter sphaeroides f. sp. denitrificans]